MCYKPELLATASSLEELKRLMTAGADAFVIGESKYATRPAGEFTQEMIRSAVELAKPNGVRIYVLMNHLIDNASLSDMPAYIAFLHEIGVDAIVFGDPAVLMAARTHAPGMGLHWNTEMTSTNYMTADYWGRRGATRYVLARELNMEQVVETKEHTNLEVQVQVHGMTNIYHSKRSLLHSYMEHQKEDGRLEGYQKEQGLYLKEEERPDEQYPIYEDASGTHIMSSDDICMLENLHELLEAKVDSLKVEGIMKSVDYNEVVVRTYRRIMDTYLADPGHYEFQDEWLEPIAAVQDPDRELSFGFFYKEQVY